MITVDVNGKSYPLCLTVDVAEAFENKYESLGNIISGYTGKSTVQAFKELLWQLAKLMKGGRDYAALFSKDSPEPLTEKELGILLPISKLGELQKITLSAISDGLTREVETEPEPKNVKTTPGRTKKR